MREFLIYQIQYQKDMTFSYKNDYKYIFQLNERKKEADSSHIVGCVKFSIKPECLKFIFSKIKTFF